jgi:DNA topoisomerase-2
MTPWYKGFKGTVSKIANNKYEIRGVYTVDEKKNTVHITELPVGIWTSNYIKFLENIIQGDKNVKGSKKIDSFLVDFKDNSYDKSIDITLKFKEGRLAEFIKDNVLESKLKLVKPISTSNMYLYNEKGIISKYTSVEDILYAFYNVRLLMYGARKEYMLKKLEYVLELLKWKRKFIKYVVEDKIIVSKRRKDEIIDDLVRLGFPQLCIKKASTNYVIGRAEHDGSEEEGASYNYITSLPLFSLTTEQINKLEEDYNKSKKEFEDLQSKTEIDLWSNELDSFMEAYLK